MKIKFLIHNNYTIIFLHICGSNKIEETGLLPDLSDH